MSRTAGATLVVLAALGPAAVPTHAQSSSPDPPRVEFTLSPAGVLVFSEKQREPEFANYRLGGAVTVNLSRFIAFEAEAGASLGLARSVDVGIEVDAARTAPDTAPAALNAARHAPYPDDHHPTTLDYNANLVFALRTKSRLVPYLSAGAGAITLFSREELGLNDNENYFTGNAGGGVKWLLRNGRWGVRADYRFLAVRSKSDAPAFFGRINRYGHRLYGALILILDAAE